MKPLLLLVGLCFLLALDDECVAVKPVGYTTYGRADFLKWTGVTVAAYDYQVGI